MTNNHPISTLALQAAQGNAEAFQQLYHLTRQRAWFVAISITKNEHDAQDILQDSYIKAWEKISTLEKPEAFAGWLSQIVANQAKNYIARKRPDSFADYGDDNAMYWQEETDVDLLPGESYDQAEAKALIAQLITQLPEDQRLVLLMRYYDDMDVVDVAQTLALPEGTVKSRLHRARAKLAAMLNQAQDKGIQMLAIAPIGLLCQVLHGLGLEEDPADKLPAIIGVATAGVAAAAGATSAATATSSAASCTAGATAAGTSITGIVAACAAVAVVAGGIIAGGVHMSRQNSAQPVDATITYTTAQHTTLQATVLPTVEVAVTEPAETTTVPYVLADTVITVPTTTSTTTTTTTEPTTSTTSTTQTTRSSLTIPDWWFNLVGNTTQATTTNTTTSTAADFVTWRDE